MRSNWSRASVTSVNRLLTTQSLPYCKNHAVPGVLQPNSHAVTALNSAVADCFTCKSERQLFHFLAFPLNKLIVFVLPAILVGACSSVPTTRPGSAQYPPPEREQGRQFALPPPGDELGIGKPLPSEIETRPLSPSQAQAFRRVLSKAKLIEGGVADGPSPRPDLSYINLTGLGRFHFVPPAQLERVLNFDGREIGA